MRLQRTRSGDGVAILSRVVPEDLSNEVTCERKPGEHEREPGALEKSTQGRRKNKRKGPEERVCLACEKKSQGGCTGTSHVTQNLA